MLVLIFSALPWRTSPVNYAHDHCRPALRRRMHTLPTVHLCRLLIVHRMNGTVLAKDVDLAIFYVVSLLLEIVWFSNVAWIYKHAISVVTTSL